MNNCSVCHQQCKEDRLLQNEEKRSFCKACYKKEYNSAQDKRCLNKCKGDTLPGPSKLGANSDVSSAVRSREKPATLFRAASKRPLQCPHKECGRFVGVYDLAAHFLHEHADVPIKHTSLNIRNSVLFHPNDVRYGVKQCLIMLNISPTDTGLQPGEIRQMVGILVLVARIGAAQLIDSDGDESTVGVEDNSAIDLLNNDKIVIWVASNVITEWGYTISASNGSDGVRVRYFGPLFQLDCAPLDLCKQGTCLFLSHFHVVGMSDNGTKPISLEVTIRGDQ